MNREKQENILHECIEKIKKGELSKEECLTYFKKHDEAMYLMLSRALILQSLPLSGPSIEYKEASKNRIFYQLMRDIELEQAVPAREPPLMKRFLQPKLQPFLTAALVIIISFGVLVGGAQAADAAGPGDFLYGLDRGIESVRLALTFNDAAKLRLMLQFAEERIHEADEQFLAGDTEDGLQALADYELAMQEVDEMLSLADSEEYTELQNLIAATNSNNQEVLTSLLEKMEKLPPQSNAQQAILHALEVSDHSANPNKPTDLPNNAQEEDKTTPADDMKATKEAESDDTEKPDNPNKPENPPGKPEKTEKVKEDKEKDKDK